MDDVVVDESSVSESLVVEVVLDELVLDEDLPDDGIVVDEDDEEDDAVAVVGVDEDVEESNNITDGGDSDVESVAKTGEMATSPTSPTAEATSERRYMGTPICRLPDRSRPGHRAGTGTSCEGEERNADPFAQQPQS